MAQIQRVAAIHQQDICLADPGDSAFFVNAGQRGKLQHAQRLPIQFAHGGFGFVSADEPPCHDRADHGVPIGRGRNAERIALSNRFAQKVNQRILNTLILDASGCEKKFFDATPRL